MRHLARLINSTNAQVIFLSETRNTKITKNDLINKFNLENAYTISAEGLSGGLWLLSRDQVEVSVIESCNFYFLAICYHKHVRKKFGLVCVYGDPHRRRTAWIWRQIRHFVMSNQDLPVICMGDMNNIMNVTEKLGPRPANQRLISNFCCLVKDCGFFDLGYHGPAYTWSNKRFSSFPTYERLDRFFGNAEWCANFPNTSVFHLPMLYSDHAPILAVLNSVCRKANHPFRFENWWLLTEDFGETARQSWKKSHARLFHLKTHYLGKDLCKWRRSKQNNSSRLKWVEANLLHVQSLPPTRNNISLQKHLISLHEDILAKEEAYHRQRYKKNWAVAGDRNTKFFHQAILKRARRNTISHFIKPDGSYATTQSQLAKVANNYFKEIFTSDRDNRLREHSWAVQDLSTERMEINPFRTHRKFLQSSRI